MFSYYVLMFVDYSYLVMYVGMHNCILLGQCFSYYVLMFVDYSYLGMHVGRHNYIPALQWFPTK